MNPCHRHVAGVTIVGGRQAILRDRNTVLSMSSGVNGYYGIRDACPSLPSVTGRVGTKSVLHPLLYEKKVKSLRDPVGILRAAISELQLEEE